MYVAYIPMAENYYSNTMSIKRCLISRKVLIDAFGQAKEHHKSFHKQNTTRLDRISKYKQH